MPSSDPERSADSLRRTLRAHERERRERTEALDPVVGDPLLARLAVELGAVPANRIEECRREIDDARRRGEECTLADVLLTRGWIEPTELERLEGIRRRRREEIPRTERYEVREYLGEGGMAVVYGAWDRQLARPVALKVLKSWAETDPAARDRFAREARAAARLNHANVVAIHDVGEVDGRPMLVLEWVDGPSWSQAIAGGGLDLRASAAILESVARAVHEAHAKGIIHRDLKPANVLLNAAGEPKVADFGLARACVGDAPVTRSGAIVGTPPYMAPEQVEGRQTETPRTDVYALGAILYQLLTGEPPHTGDSLVGILRKILEDEPRPPRVRNPKAPVELEAVAMRALDKDPGRRYPTALAFAEEIARWRTGRPVEARAPGAMERVWRRLRRHPRTSIALAGCAALALGLGAWGWSNAAWRAERDAAEAARAQSGLAAVALLERVQAAVQAGEFVAAETLAREAVGLAPRAPGARRALAGILFRRWMVEVAAERLEARTPGDPEARARLGREIAEHAGAALGGAEPGDDPARGEWAAALVALVAGGVEEAGRRAAAAAEAHAHAAPDLHALAGCAFAIRSLGLFTSLEAMHQERDRALRHLGDAIRGRPDAPLPRLVRAALLHHFGGSARTDAVAWSEDAEVAVRGDPHNAEARLFRAIARFSRGEAETALEDVDTALRLVPGEPAAHLLRARIRLDRDRDLPGALADLDAVLARIPDSVTARFQRGHARLQAGRADAVEDFDRVLERAPETLYAYFYRSLAHERAGNHDAALADVDQGLARAADENTRKVFEERRRALRER